MGLLALRHLLFGAVLLAAAALALDIVDEPWASRLPANKFGLGPAPFPHPRQMDYELFGTAKVAKDREVGEVVQLTKLEQHQKVGFARGRPTAPHPGAPHPAGVVVARSGCHLEQAPRGAAGP